MLEIEIGYLTEVMDGIKEKEAKAQAGLEIDALEKELKKQESKFWYVDGLCKKGEK